MTNPIEILLDWAMRNENLAAILIVIVFLAGLLSVASVIIRMLRRGFSYLFGTSVRDLTAGLIEPLPPETTQAEEAEENEIYPFTSEKTVNLASPPFIKGGANGLHYDPAQFPAGYPAPAPALDLDSVFEPRLPSDQTGLSPETPEKA